MGPMAAANLQLVLLGTFGGLSLQDAAMRNVKDGKESRAVSRALGLHDLDSQRVLWAAAMGPMAAANLMRTLWY